MNETELNVVCKSCGAEVSPYVTECPYCGARLRKRAPDLEHRDGGIEPKLSRRQRRRLQQHERGPKHRGSTVVELFSLPFATLILVALPALVLLVRTAVDLDPGEVGGLTVPVAGEWWRLVTASFIYESIGYLFVVGLALAIFTPGIERRLGTIPSLILLIACGVLGTLAGYGIALARDLITTIGGGNGIALGAVAAWYFSGHREDHGHEGSSALAGALVTAAVLLLLPLVVDGVDPWVGIVGGLVGGIAGVMAGRARS